MSMIDEIVERLRQSENNWYALAKILWGDRFDLRAIDPDIFEMIMIGFCADEGVRVLDVPRFSAGTLRRLDSLPTIGVFRSVFPRLDENPVNDRG